MYLKPVEKREETEYNENNFLRTSLYNNKDYDSYIQDYQQIIKEYDMLPEQVKRRLFLDDQVKVVFNYTGRSSSGYNPNTKEILLLSNVEEGEFIHEVGHALYYTLDVNKYKTYQDVINYITKNSSIVEFNDKAIPYFGLDTKYKVASHYQTFLGYDKLTAQSRFNQKNLIETMSEAYREYYFGKKQSVELNRLVEEVENSVK